MKRWAMGLMTVFLLAQARAAEPNWTTDYAQAVGRARAEHKLVLLFFTGSDWCPGCLHFSKEVLSTGAFADYAKAHLVLVLVDFPHKAPQSDALKAANKALEEQYRVEGYPTSVVLNGAGKEVGREEGYDGRGPKKFIATLEGIARK